MENRKSICLKKELSFCQNKSHKNCFQCKTKSQEIELVYCDQIDDTYKINCYYTFTLKHILNIYHEQILKLEDNDEECLIQGQLIYNDCCQNVTFQLDSGSMANILSYSLLKQIFPNQEFSFQQTNTQLFGANQLAIKCKGVLSLKCKIGDKCIILDFFIIKDSNILLLSWKTIKKFGLIINSSINQCKIFYTFEKNKGLTQDYIIFKILENYFDFEINRIVLMPIMDTSAQNLLYKYLSIYNCNCRINNYELCTKCVKRGPLATIFFQGKNIDIEFLDKGLINLPQDYGFQGVILTSRITQTVNTVMPAAVGIDQIIEESDDVQLEPAGFQTDGEGEVFFQHALLELPSDKSENDCQEQLNIQELLKENCCSYCTLKNLKYCDYLDQHCQNYIKFRKSLIQTDYSCQLIFDHKSAEECRHKVIFIQSGKEEKLESCYWFKEIKDQYLKLKPEFEKSGKEIDFFTLSQGHFIWLLLIARTQMYYQFCKILQQLKIYCIERKIKSLHFLNFNHCLISNNCLIEIFFSYEIKLFLSKHPYKEVLRINTDKNIKGNILETVEVNEVIDPLQISSDLKTKMKALIERMSKKEEGLDSLWAKSSTDIGMFHDNVFPYSPFYFNLSVRKDCTNYVPYKEKSRFVSPKLQPECQKIAEKLLEANIIANGYSNFNAQCVYVTRRIELTLKEHIRQGGTLENYIPGTTDSNNFGVRLCVDFFQLNSILEESTITQQSPLQLLKTIAADTTVISTLDISSSFFHICLSDSSRILCGFELGLSNMNNSALWLRMPMGCRQAKSFQDICLMHSLKNIKKILLFSDNIIIYSKNYEENYQTLEQVFEALRLSGWKIRLGKLSLFCTKNINLFGFNFDIADKKITPSLKKISALQEKKIPSCLSEVKSYLGSLAFFSPFLPILDESVAIYSELTKKNNFFLTENHLIAYENLFKMLSQPGLIYTHLPDYQQVIKICTDASCRKISYIFYQVIDEKPKVLSYNHKLLHQKHEAYPPSYNELLAILFAIKQFSLEYEGCNCVLYTDAKVLALCCVASTFNAKLARIKLFLQSQAWIKISYEKADSDVIKISDFWSRQNTQKSKKYSQKLPSFDDEKYCSFISEKIDKTQRYSFKTNFWILDYILNFEQSNLKKIKQNTVRVENNKIVFETEESNDIPDTDENQDNDKMDDKNQSVEFSEKNQNKTIKTVFQTNTRLKHSLQKIEVKLPDDNTEEIKDIESFIIPVIHKPRPSLKQAINKSEQNNLTPFESYFENLRERMPFLDREGFISAQLEDPYFESIYRKCKTNRKFVDKNKIYFLHEKVLFCKQVLNGIEYFQICLPSHCAFDVILFTHKNMGHLKSVRLSNYLSQAFVIPNVLQTCKIIVDQCSVCSLNSPKSFGSTDRRDYQKFPKLLRKPRQIFSVDELLLFRNKNVTIKILMGVCLFSNYVIIHKIPVNQNVTGQHFIEFIRKLQGICSNEIQFLHSDNASCLNSEEVLQVCKELNINKITSSAYMPKSQLSELFNRVICDYLRTTISYHSLDPELILEIIDKVVGYINTNVFFNSKILSAYCLFYGCKPTNILSYQLNEKYFESKETYFRATLKLNHIFRKLRYQYLDKRSRELESQTKLPLSTKHNNAIQVGDIVTLINRYRLKNKHSKLMPNFMNKFCVVQKTQTSCLIQPLEDTSLEDYLRLSNFGKPEKQEKNHLLFKVDVTYLKKYVPTVICHKENDFFLNWSKSWFLPKPLYVTQNQEGKILTTWDKLYNYNSEISDYELANNYFSKKFLLQIKNQEMSQGNCGWFEQKCSQNSNQMLKPLIQPKLKSILKSDYNLELDKIFKILGNYYPNVRIKKKSVSFDESRNQIVVLPHKMLYFGVCCTEQV